MLSNYGIHSNTSANSFLKCIFRKTKDGVSGPTRLPQTTAATPAQVGVGLSAQKGTEASGKVKRR